MQRKSRSPKPEKVHCELKREDFKIQPSSSLPCVVASEVAFWSEESTYFRHCLQVYRLHYSSFFVVYI